VKFPPTGLPQLSGAPRS